MTVTLVLNDTHRYARVETEFVISILPPGAIVYTIASYTDGNSLVPVPSAFTKDEITVHVYNAQGYILDQGPMYGFTPPPPFFAGDFKTIDKDKGEYTLELFGNFSFRTTSIKNAVLSNLRFAGF
ncbi:MAG: hypothetical protein LBB47_05325 [Spirochaetaceae bacterium]|jgi:hypothetical protein|nr:hypothetical protein [Spirochaetaceae bacterium]